MFDGAQLVPYGSNRFRKSDPAVMYCEIYEPLLITAKDAQHLPMVGIEVRVLDRKTGAAKSDTGLMRINAPMKAGNPVIPIGMKMPIGALAPGSYRLEMSAADTAGKQYRRSADFEIE